MDETVRYRRVRSLGRGAMGEVWLADDSLLHRQVALKTVASYGPPDPADLDRIMREARLAARLNHPNAVAVYDVFVENGQPCVVMEYASGKSLAERIAESGRLPAGEVGRIGMALADALAEAHRLGIVHRDVKPANILITDRGMPKLADFGIARGLDSATTVTGLAIGTPAYLAPEQARGAPADTRSDVWSLGVTLYAALDGRSPFALPGDDPLTVIGRLAMTPQVAPPQHGGELSRTVMSAMAVDPARRPTAEAMVGMLREDLSDADRTNRWVPPPAMSGDDHHTTAGRRPARASGPCPSNRRRGATGAGVHGWPRWPRCSCVAAAGTLAWYLLRSDHTTPSAHTSTTTAAGPVAVPVAVDADLPGRDVHRPRRRPGHRTQGLDARQLGRDRQRQRLRRSPARTAITAPTSGSASGTRSPRRPSSWRSAARSTSSTRRATRTPTCTWSTSATCPSSAPMRSTSSTSAPTRRTSCGTPANGCGSPAGSPARSS